MVRLLLRVSFGTRFVIIFFAGSFACCRDRLCACLSVVHKRLHALRRDVIVKLKRKPTLTLKRVVRVGKSHDRSHSLPLSLGECVASHARGRALPARFHSK